MTSNVYTKSEILKNLSDKGYFIDSYTLDTFFKKWQIEAIFEDEQGSEFYDKNALDTMLNNLFNLKEEKEKKEQEEKEKKEQEEKERKEKEEQEEKIKEIAQAKAEEIIKQRNEINSKPKIMDSEANQILNDISLSDGTPLIDSMQGAVSIDDLIKNEANNQFDDVIEPRPFKEKKMGILEGALKIDEESPAQESSQTILPVESDNSGDFDDISLLSESLEAQEKFREYVVSELTKKNVDLTPKNEFKLDISERTLNMIARSMAKKIAKHVSAICSQDAKSQAKLEDLEEENKRLEQKARHLEEQNKKLRLLLAESNKNLNSYKPSVFGLYKKVPPQNNK